MAAAAATTTTAAAATTTTAAAAAAAQPPTYSDPVYEAAHTATFSRPLTEVIDEVLPPGVARDDFARAVRRLVDALGDDRAVLTGQDLRDYVDPYEIPEGGGHRSVPSAAVCPSSVEQIQEVLKVLNEFGIPLWTFSRGKNLGYGGPAPRVRGSICLDLHRMDRVLEVSEKFAYAVVEPGVTFGDLHGYCVEHKIALWPSVASLGWGSVMGNALDRGLGFLPNGTHYENIVGMEVVLANGDVVRTGQFAMTTSAAAHCTKLTFGPSRGRLVDGLFLQSNLGIVTKIGINLTPQPQAYMACSFDMPELEDIATIADVFGEMRRDGTLPGMVYVFYITEWASFAGRRSAWWQGEGPIPDWRLRELQAELDVGRWTVKFGLFGPPGLVDAHYARVRDVVAARAPTGRLQGSLFTGTDDGRLDAAEVPQPHGGIRVGVPSMFSIPMVDYYNAQPGSVGAHGAYSPIIPLDGATLLDWVRAAKAVYEAHGFDLMCDFFLHDKYALFVCMLCFDKTSAEQRRGTDAVFHGLFEQGSKRGFAKYRAHINHMDQNAELFDFNDHAYRRFVETLKDALDPNGILSPGKMGIWPKRFRESKDEDQA
ncbi:vanillyl alcohol oxidase [Xylariaceae sp. FL0804]|nr:vanillyl alcohol oxidase [Xylariaceae sp. FL0804]